tara:strand:- start:10335 stop:10595 length:261 start_codon:yes stop_codon:yes gene_type:complete
MDTNELFDWQPIPFDVSLYMTVGEAKRGRKNLEEISKAIEQSPLMHHKSSKAFCLRRIQHNQECIAQLTAQIQLLRARRGFNNSKL